VSDDNDGAVGMEPTPTTTGQLLMDMFKHLTTLSAGSLVLIATFLKDIFPRDNGLLDVCFGLKLLIGASFAFLGISLISSVVFILRLSNEATSPQPGTVLAFISSRTSLYLQVASLLAFLTGLLCFGAAVLINLF
jgi:hypothetical protein